MGDKIDRREFLKIGTASTLGVGAMSSGLRLASAATEKTVRLGVVGVGGRGTSHVETLLAMGGVEIPAICDINQQHLTRAQSMVEKAGQKRPERGTGAMWKTTSGWCTVMTWTPCSSRPTGSGTRPWRCAR